MYIQYNTVICTAQLLNCSALWGQIVEDKDRIGGGKAFTELDKLDAGQGKL